MIRIDANDERLICRNVETFRSYVGALRTECEDSFSSAPKLDLMEWHDRLIHHFRHLRCRKDVLQYIKLAQQILNPRVCCLGTANTEVSEYLYFWGRVMPNMIVDKYGHARPDEGKYGLKTTGCQ